MIWAILLILTPPSLAAFKDNSCVRAAEQQTKLKGQSKDTKAYADQQMIKSLKFIEEREKKPGYSAKQILLDLYEENKKSCPEMTKQVPDCSLKDCEKLSDILVDQTKALPEAAATSALRMTKAQYQKQTSGARGKDPVTDTSVRDTFMAPTIREITGKPLPKGVLDHAGEMERKKNIENQH